MPTTVVVPVLVMLCIGVLAPSIFRRIREYQAVEGIDTFHASLHLLQRHGTHLEVAPLAERRPQLVLLRPVADADAAVDVYVDEESGACFDRVPIAHDPLPAYEPLRRRGKTAQAKRRRNVLCSLIAATAVGLGGGLITGTPMLLGLGIISLVLLSAFIAAAIAIVSRPVLSASRSFVSTSEAIDSDYDIERRYAAHAR